MPNSEVKCCNADGSVGSPHVRVGHRRITNQVESPLSRDSGLFALFVFCMYSPFQIEVIDKIGAKKSLEPYDIKI
jgi:hypothetical protein